MTDLRKLYNDAYAAQREKDYLESGKGDHFEAQTAAIAAITAHFDEREKAYSASIRTLSDALTGLGRKVTLDYTNHRGERAMRTVTPASVEYGTTKWHPEPDLLIHCYDHDRAAVRIYAWSGVHSWDGQPVAAASGAVELREAALWGIEDTGDAIWIGPMRSGGRKIDRVVYFVDDLGLHRKEYVAQVKADARLIVEFFCGKNPLARPVAEEPAAPVEGWQLVPVEPTQEMLDAAVKGSRADVSYADVEELWPAMLAAAPKANGVGTGGEGLREALKPFVAHYQPWMDDWADDKPCTVFAMVTFGDLRRARAAIGAPPSSGAI